MIQSTRPRSNRVVRGVMTTALFGSLALGMTGAFAAPASTPKTLTPPAGACNKVGEKGMSPYLAQYVFYK
jgi:hypothetical protein